MNQTISFPVDHRLLNTAREILAPRRNLVWLVGGSCAGKSTVCLELSRQGIAVCDMDRRIFADYMAHYTPGRYPASSAWLTREDGLAWVLSLSWPEFDDLNAATNAEWLALLAAELRDLPPDRPLVVDGGLSHPALLAQVLDPRQVLCLEREEGVGTVLWQTDEKRIPMMEAILAMTDGEALWRKFLDFDRRINETIRNECQRHAIPILRVDDGASPAHTAAAVVAHFALSPIISREMSNVET